MQNLLRSHSFLLTELLDVACVSKDTSVEMHHPNENRNILERINTYSCIIIYIFRNIKLPHHNKVPF